VLTGAVLPIGGDERRLVRISRAPGDIIEGDVVGATPLDISDLGEGAEAGGRVLVTIKLTSPGQQGEAPVRSPLHPIEVLRAYLMSQGTRGELVAVEDIRGGDQGIVSLGSPLDALGGVVVPHPAGRPLYFGESPTGEKGWGNQDRDQQAARTKNHRASPQIHSS